MGLIAKFTIPGVTKKNRPAFGGFVGTTSGWLQFGTWADTLDVGAYERVVHCWEHGFVNQPGDLAKQLADALAKHGKKLSEGGRAVADSLLSALKGRDKKAETVWIIDDAAEVPG
jgi:hypothetical protein